MRELVVIKGGGDIATGVAHRLYRSGFHIVITEIPFPTVVRRTVAFSGAVFSKTVTIEGVTAKNVDSSQINATLAAGCIPVVIDPAAACIRSLCPQAVVDAIIAKRNTGTSLTDAPVVIGLGPGFTAGQDVHAVIETMRGHNLGRVIENGTALPNTGVPGEIGSYTLERLLKAPCTGLFSSCAGIGDIVSAGQTVGYVAGHAVQTAIAGILRGLIHDGACVTAGMKIGDVDPRCHREHCFTISDKARAVAGGVLEAILHLRSKQSGCI